VGWRCCEVLGLDGERSADTSAEKVFVVLKGSRRGSPLTADGLGEVLADARGRAGLRHGTCHQLRHSCLTRLREAGMALEAVQALDGHAFDRVDPDLPVFGR
jgi:integrase/recombinase XerD